MYEALVVTDIKVASYITLGRGFQMQVYLSAYRNPQSHQKKKKKKKKKKKNQASIPSQSKNQPQSTYSRQNQLEELTKNPAKS